MDSSTVTGWLCVGIGVLATILQYHPSRLAYLQIKDRKAGQPSDVVGGGVMKRILSSPWLPISSMLTCMCLIAIGLVIIVRANVKSNVSQNSQPQLAASTPSISNPMQPKTANIRPTKATETRSPSDVQPRNKTSDKRINPNQSEPSAPVSPGIVGANNISMFDNRPIKGDDNIIIGATDAQGNTILRAGTAIGHGAKADPTSIAIGTNAGGGSMNCPNGICNGAPNYGTQTVDNRHFGDAVPPPNIIGLSVGTKKDKPRATPLPPDNLLNYPEQIAEFTVDKTFSQPIFLVTCDRPCIVASEQVVGTSSPNFLSTSNPLISGVALGTATPLLPGTKVAVDVRSRDSLPIRILKIDPYIAQVR